MDNLGDLGFWIRALVAGSGGGRLEGREVRGSSISEVQLWSRYFRS